MGKAFVFPLSVDSVSHSVIVVFTPSLASLTKENWSLAAYLGSTHFFVLISKPSYPSCIYFSLTKANLESPHIMRSEFMLLCRLETPSAFTSINGSLLYTLVFSPWFCLGWCSALWPFVLGWLNLQFRMSGDSSSLKKSPTALS